MVFRAFVLADNEYVNNATHSIIFGGIVSVNDRQAAASSKSAARWIAPLAAAMVAVLVGAVLLLPMMKMNPREIPVAVLSLDEGVTVSGEQINAGTALTEALLDSQEDEDSAMVAWTVFESQGGLDAAMENGDYYAAIVVPADFSERQVAIAVREVLGSALVEKLPELNEEAASLAGGASALHEGSIALSSGASQLSSGAGSLAALTESLPGKAQDLASGAQALSESMSKLGDAAAGLKNVGSGLYSDGGALSQAIAALETANAALSNQDQSDDAEAIKSAQIALNSIASTAASLYPGIEGLATGLSAACQGADALSQGTIAFEQAAPKLSQGATALAEGAAKVESAASALSSGASTLSTGAGAYSEAVSEAHDALEALPVEADDKRVADVDAESLANVGSAALGLSAASSGPSIKLVINQGKNPMVTNSLSAVLSGLAASSGLAFETTYVNELPENMGIGVTHMILMILTYIGSYATGAVIANVMKPQRRDKRGIAVGLAIQAAYAFVCALVVGFAAAGVLQIGLGGTIPFVELALFVAIASLSFQLLVIGALTLLGTAGMLVPIGLLVVGMGAAYLPMEFLPEFWQNYVYPWDPLRYMVDGFRAILYMGEGFANDAAGPLLLMAVIGVALMILGAVRNAHGSHMFTSANCLDDGKEQAYVQH